MLAITLFTGLLSQRWAGLDTPDSSFYASLSLFGDEVSDRAPDNSYYWTRLGYIVPVRLLTTTPAVDRGTSAQLDQCRTAQQRRQADQEDRPGLAPGGGQSLRCWLRRHLAP